MTHANLNNTQQKPLISVVMSAYNSEEHLAEAIESILQQSFTDFEFIIIDDASTDQSLSVMREYAAHDSRIIVLENAKNMRLAASLNKGIEQARGEFIARMDADDVALVDRLQKQFDFMSNKPELGVSGCWVSVYESPNIVWKTAISPAAANCAAFFESCFHHPTVMIRKDILDRFGGYDETIEFAQDCHLWSRLAFEQSVQLNNLPEVLLRYRSHPDKQRGAYREKQHARASDLRHANLSRLGIEYDDEDFAQHNVLCSGLPMIDSTDFQNLLAWIRRLERANLNSGLLQPAAFKYELSQKLLRVCLASAPNTLIAPIVYLSYCRLMDLPKNIYRAIRMLLLYLVPKKNA